MSGGALDYFYSTLDDHVGDFGDKELDELVKDLAVLFRDREWYLSSDYGIGNWNEARDNFKKKWFSEHGRQERIEKYLDETVREIKDAFGLGNYCQDCAEFTPEEDGGSYGRCHYHTHCLMHRSDPACEKFISRSFRKILAAKIGEEETANDER